MHKSHQAKQKTNFKKQKIPKSDGFQNFRSQAVFTAVVCTTGNFQVIFSPQIRKQICLIQPFLRHLPEVFLHSRYILFISYTVPGIVGFKNLGWHLFLHKQRSDECRNQVFCLEGIHENFFLEKLDKTLFQNFEKCRSQTPTYSWIPGNWHPILHRQPRRQPQSWQCFWFPQLWSGCCLRP